MRGSINMKKITLISTSIFLILLYIIFIFVSRISNVHNKYDENNIGECYFQETEKVHIARDKFILYADNEILVVAEENVGKKEIEELSKKYNAEIVGYIEQTGDFQLKLKDSYSIDKLESLVEDIKNEEIIYSSSINYISEISQSDLPIQYGKEWSNEIWDENEQNGINWGLEAIHCISAWTILENNKEKVKPIRLGLIDSGFDINHEDLAFARTFYNTENDIDDIDHGTSMSGIMAADSNDDIGVCGVYPFGSQEKPCLYGVSWRGMGKYTENLASCMTLKCAFSELILRNVKVINCSFSQSKILDIQIYNDEQIKQTVENTATVFGDFLNRLLEKGYDFLIVQGAGNDSNKKYTRFRCDGSSNIIYNKDGSVTYDEKGVVVIASDYITKEWGQYYYYSVEDKKKHKINGINDECFISSNIMESKYVTYISAIEEKEYPDVYNRIIVVGSIGIEPNFSKALFDNSISINYGASGYHISEFSNLGSRLDVVAPGELIFSTIANNKYGDHLNDGSECSGTSASTAYTSGIAAMVWSTNNELSGAEVKNIICCTANHLVNLGENGSEYNKTEYKLVNAQSAIEKALGIEKELTTQEPKNGGILNYVVEKDSEDIKIKDAQVVAVGTDGTGHTTTTDNAGHFELFLPEGTYSLTITKDGYKPYTWKNIEVKNEGVNYLSDWTKLEKIYDWHLSPTIEAEDIIVSDVEKINYYGFNGNPFDEYSIVSENGKYRFIKYDGTYISDKQYDEWYFSKPDAITCSSKNNECVTILGENGNEISYEPHDSGWGRKGYYIDNKTKTIYDVEYGCFATPYNEINNVVVQQADITIIPNENNPTLEIEVNNAGKYGIANNNGLIVDCIYDDACMNIGDNIIALEKDGKWSYFNKDGAQIIDFVCEPFESKILDVMWLHNHDGKSIQHPFLSSSGYIPVKINGQCGYYDTQGNEVIPCGTFEDVRPVHNGLAWVKKDDKWGAIKLSNAEQEITDDLIVQTENLTNSDIKTEWEHITSLELEYPIFITSNNELKNFLDTAISEKILSYMETDTDYNLRIDGGFEYDMSIDGYLSINGYISNHAEGGNGFYGYSCYTFFVDLQNRKILTLNELFSEPENVVYNEIATKTNQYVNGDIKSGLLSKTALSDYDYRNCKFTLNKDNLTIIFNPYEVTTGIVGVVTIEIPISDLNLTCIIPEIKTKGFQNENDSKIQSESTETQTNTTAVSDNEILKAVNKYLEENQSNLGVWLSDGNPYCPSGYTASNDKNWSCPINTDWDRYSSNEITGAYPHFAYVDKSTLKCTLTANYETVVEFDLSAYLK